MSPLMAPQLYWREDQKSWRYLQPLPTHEAWLCCCRRNAFAHGSPPQRTDVLQQRKPKAARALQRQEFRQQAAIEEINRERPAHHVGATHLRVTGGQLIRTRIVSPPMSGGH